MQVEMEVEGAIKNTLTCRYYDPTYVVDVHIKPSKTSSLRRRIPSLFRNTCLSSLRLHFFVFGYFCSATFWTRADIFETVSNKVYFSQWRFNRKCQHWLVIWWSPIRCCTHRQTVIFYASSKILNLDDTDFYTPNCVVCSYNGCYRYLYNRLYPCRSSVLRR